MNYLKVKESFAAEYASYFNYNITGVLPENEAAVIKCVPNYPENRTLISKIWKTFKAANRFANDYEMRYRYRGPRDATLRGKYNAQSYALQSEGKTFSVYIYEKNKYQWPAMPAPASDQDLAMEADHLLQGHGIWDGYKENGTVKASINDSDWQDGFEAGLAKADGLVLRLIMKEFKNLESLSGLHMALKAIREQQNIEIAKGYK